MLALESVVIALAAVLIVRDVAPAPSVIVPRKFVAPTELAPFPIVSVAAPEFVTVLERYRVLVVAKLAQVWLAPRITGMLLAEEAPPSVKLPAPD